MTNARIRRFALVVSLEFEAAMALPPIAVHLMEDDAGVAHRFAVVILEHEKPQVRRLLRLVLCTGKSYGQQRH